MNTLSANDLWGSGAGNTQYSAPSYFSIMSDIDEDLVEASDEEGDDITAAQVLKKLEEVRGSMCRSL